MDWLRQSDSNYPTKEGILTLIIASIIQKLCNY